MKIIKTKDSKFKLTEHAIQRLRERGVPNEEVQKILNNIKPFRYFHVGIWKNGYYDEANKIFISEINGNIKTVISDVKLKYIENLKKLSQ